MSTFFTGPVNPYIAVTPTPASRPPIAVILPTHNRAEAVVQAIASLKANLSYAGEIRYYVGVDGDDDTPARVLSTFPDVTLVPGPRRGLGANLNSLMRAANADLIYQQDDDCYRVKPLDLTPYADKLLTDPTAGWVRIMWNSSHRFTADLDGVYWRVRWDSIEHYLPSGRVHLKHRRFHEYYGPYHEGLKVGETEDGFCFRFKDVCAERGPGPSILIPLECDSEHGWVHGVGVRTLNEARQGQ